MITDRLKSAMDKETETAAAEAPVVSAIDSAVDAGSEKLIETTDEEIEAFFVVKSILRTTVDPARIFYRDAQSYFSIILDDNNRKAICRLYLNGSRKYIGTFDSAKKETKNELMSLDDIYNYTEQLQQTVDIYLSMK